jgi:hypothetical protein
MKNNLITKIITIIAIGLIVGIAYYIVSNYILPNFFGKQTWTQAISWGIIFSALSSLVQRLINRKNTNV